MLFSVTLQGKYAEAEPLYERATKVLQTALGPDHPNVATSLNNWAGLLKGQVRAVGISRIVL